MKRAPWVIMAAIFVGCSEPRPKPKQLETVKEVFKVDPATAGTVSGRVLYSGTRTVVKRINIDEDTECVRLNRTGMYDQSLVINKNGTVSNVFVYIKEGLEGKQFERPQQPVVLDQKGCRFTPRVLGVQAGQTFKVVNSDPVTHNVHPIAKMNREWNQSQGPGDPPLERRFARPEVMVRVKCNVHSWMRSWVGVMDHPYYAVTGPGGSFEIPNLPPGDYTIEAWQENLGVLEQQVTVNSRAATQLEFKFKGDKL